MTQKNCPDCKTPVNTTDTHCTYCGALQAPIQTKPKNQSVRNNYSSTRAILLTIGIISLIVAVKSLMPSDITQRNTTPLSPEEIRQKQIESAFSIFDGSHIALEQKVKKNLKDPDSYEHIETRYVDKQDYIIVQLKYRAKNSFNGYVVNTATAKANIDGSLIEASLSE